MWSSIKVIICIIAVIIIVIVCFFNLVVYNFVFGSMSLDILYLIKKNVLLHILKIAEYQYCCFFHIFQHCVDKSIAGLHQ